MRTIRVDDEVWQSLQRRATPFEDTPNTVLRRVLRLDAKTKPESTRRPKRQRALGRTPQEAYRRPILKALIELDGKATAGDVLDRVGEKVQSTLKPVDYEKVSSGMIRWRNAAMWERSAMVRDGLLRSDSQRGYWEISERGRTEVQNLRRSKRDVA